MNVKCGVAQGSMLSTTLFSIFINDIFDLSLKGKLQLYADDAVIIYQNRGVHDVLIDIQNDLQLVNAWLSKNCMSMNASKTNYIIFEKNRTIDYTNVPDISIDSQRIERVSETKYLGLHIDNKLSWKTQIKHIKNKINPILFALRRLRYCLNVKARWNIYNAYIMSHLLYLNPIWTSTTQTNLNKIRVLQNKVIRVIHGFSRLHPTDDLYDASVLSFDKISEYQLLLLIYKIKHGYIKHNIELSYQRNIHRYETRRRSHIVIPQTRTNTGLNGILSRGYRVFNQLPSEIKNLLNISSFKSKLLELISN